MEKEINPDFDRHLAQEMISAQGYHACRGSLDSMCPVTSIISNDILFVSNKNHLSCTHYVPFGNGGYCNSHIRKNIYEAYKL